MSFIIHTPSQPEAIQRSTVSASKPEVPQCPIHYSEYISAEDAFNDGCKKCKDRRNYENDLLLKAATPSIAVAPPSLAPSGGGMAIYVDPTTISTNCDFF